MSELVTTPEISTAIQAILAAGIDIVAIREATAQ
jgi:hypothetical protein